MKDSRPNILFIMSDDHASHAMSCYGSRINDTPNLDRIAQDGMRFDNCFCTNSICVPSRASILTGQYSHINGATTLSGRLAPDTDNLAKHLQAAGYDTAQLMVREAGFDVISMEVSEIQKCDGALTCLSILF